MSEPVKVAVAGPARVGKTTLLTAVLSDTEDMLATTPVSVIPKERTAARIRQQKRDLRRAIEAEEFNAAALGGTQSMSEYDITLRPDGDFGVEIPFRILDYPGMWLNPDRRAESTEAVRNWPRFEEHIKNSIMLLLPIDAAVLMEAVTPAQKSAVTDLLGLVDVEAIARQWAKARGQRPDEPAVVVLAPIKCEKYFSDNGYPGNGDSRLRAQVAEKYHEALRIIREETAGRELRTVYVPIDTYGCVHLMEVEWPDLGADGPGHLEFVGRYRFRGRPPKIKVKGAGTVMQELCRCIVSREVRAEQGHMDERHRDYNLLLGRKAQDKGFWGTVLYYVGGEAWDNRTGRYESIRELEKHRQQRDQLVGALQKIVSAELEPKPERLELW